MWRLEAEGGAVMRRLKCWVNLHRWRYFIDGSICRSCTVCPRVQYDLPMHGVDRNADGAPTNKKKGWLG